MQRVNAAPSSGKYRPFLALLLALSIQAVGIESLARAATPDHQQYEKDASLRSTGFQEPLIAVHVTSVEEDSDLDAAIRLYQKRTAPDDITSLQAFLSRHPNSGWRLAVLTNIGLSDYHYGYFSKAISDFQQAWFAGQSATNVRAVALADRAGGELLKMHARLGHAAEVAALLEEMKGRGLSGPASEMRTGAREGLWLMRNKPGEAYLCGPMALKNLLRAGGAPKSSFAFLDTYQSSPKGVTLAEVDRLASQAKLPHTLIYRQKDDPVPVPSIVHWKVNHFAALVEQRGDRFHLMDPTFGDSLWVTRAALDSESSGYFLVPVANEAAAWRPVGTKEAAQIYGMGTTTGSNPNNVTDGSPCACSGSSQSQDLVTDVPDTDAPPDADFGMTRYNFKEMLVSLRLTDTPVGYTPPKGPPVRVRITYNQREANQPTTFSFFNVSPKWTLNWLSYVEDDPTMPGANAMRYEAGGGASPLVGYSATTQTYAPDLQDASALTLVTAGSATTYRRTLSDGSVEVYGESNGATAYPRLIFLSQMIDPYGNTVNLNYDSMFRLTSIVDATGRTTKFVYDNKSDPLLVTRITDPFGRSANLSYDTSGRLIEITDVLGLRSQFSYDSSSLVDSLKTPYGKTFFEYGDNGNQRYLQATDPLGHTERLEYYQGAPGIPASDPLGAPQGIVAPFNDYLYGRDTFYWDKHAYAAAAGIYTMARNRHWAHLDTNTSWTSDTLESVKYPLEHRIWYNHPGQPTSGLGAGESGSYEKPTNAARILDDGSTQLTQTQYATTGNVTSFIDASGRQTQFQYASNLVDVTEVDQQTATSFAPIAKFTYATPHLPSAYTDASGQTTHFAYNGAGQVTQVTDPLGETTTYAYNSLGYLIAITNANRKRAYSFAYDKFGRVSSLTDSEGWTVEFAYDAMDRLISETFPDGTTRTYTYSNLDLISVKDRQGRVTQASYDANRNLISVTDPLGNITKFGRYENGKLKTLTDPNGHTTSWTIDVESRVTGKQYANKTQTGYGYEGSTSRLLFIADQLNQIKQFSYTRDSKVAGITFFNAVNATPNVAFAYDPYFPRVTSMTDGNGTTTYQYGALGAIGALRLALESPPFQNAAIAYQYDALGRVTARSVGGNVEKLAYDAIGRTVTHVDDLGTFTRSYLGQTNQLTSQSNGVVSTTWTYDTNTNDRRLIQIATLGGTTYGLTTTPENDLTGLSDSYNALTWTYTYDAADRLLSGVSSTSLKYGYAYDAAGNLGTIQRPTGTTTVTSGPTNQIAAVNGVGYAYDVNGNLRRDYARTYAWDADNRLIAIGYPGQTGMRTGFRYDGLGRRTAIDTTNGRLMSETRFGWCEQAMCQARSDTDAVTNRYFVEGEEPFAINQQLYYGVDQLGSVRDAVIAGSGARVAHYDYEPYGAPSNKAKATTDFRFGGLVSNAQSSIDLSSRRALDPLTARWITRDPIGEIGGVNVYGYAWDRPTVNTDIAGLIPGTVHTTMSCAIFCIGQSTTASGNTYDVFGFGAGFTDSTVFATDMDAYASGKSYSASFSVLTMGGNSCSFAVGLQANLSNWKSMLARLGSLSASVTWGYSADQLLNGYGAFNSTIFGWGVQGWGSFHQDVTSWFVNF